MSRSRQINAFSGTSPYSVLKNMFGKRAPEWTLNLLAEIKMVQQEKAEETVLKFA